MEGLVGGGDAGPVGAQQVGVTLAIGVVDLGDDAGQLALVVEAPEDRQRVEDVPQDPGVGQHDDPSPVPEADAVG